MSVRYTVTHVFQLDRVVSNLLGMFLYESIHTLVLAMKSSWLIIFLQIERSLLSLYRETQDKTHHSCTKYLDKGTKRYDKTWNSAPFGCGKHGHASKRQPGESFPIHFSQAGSTFPVAHSEEKVKTTSSCFLCSYVIVDVFMSKHERERFRQAKWTMASLLGHCHGEKTHFSRNEKRTFSSSQMNNVELARTLSWRENALLEKREKTINSLAYLLVFLQTCPPVNSSTVVIFSVRNLTLWVPFLSTYRQPSRKKSILAQVCFGAKRG